MSTKMLINLTLFALALLIITAEMAADAARQQRPCIMAQALDANGSLCPPRLKLLTVD